MDWAVKMMQKVCKVFSTPVEGKNFLQSVAKTFAYVILEILQSLMSGEYKCGWAAGVNKMHSSLHLRHIILCRLIYKLRIEEADIFCVLIFP